MAQKTARVSQAAEASGVLKQVQMAFTSYQVSRNNFLNALQGFLVKKDDPTILAALLTNNVMEVLCCPLAHDPVPGIQDLSLQCLAKLSTADGSCAEAVMSCGIVDSAMVSMAHDNASVQIAASELMRALASSSHDNSAKLIDAGVMARLKLQLVHSSMGVRESAVRAITSLVHMGEEYAADVLDDEVLDQLMTMLQSPTSPGSLTLAVVVALSNVCAYNGELAQRVAAGGALSVLGALLRRPGLHHELRAAVLTCLSHTAKHSEELAAQVTHENVTGLAVSAMSDPMVGEVRRAAASLILQVARKTPELAEAMVEQGATSALTRYFDVEGSRGGLLTGVAAVGQLASYRPTIARALSDASTHHAVIACVGHADLEVAGTAAWALEQIAQHGPDEAMPLVHAGAVLKLMDRYTDLRAAGTGPHDSPAASAFTKHKAAIKALLRGCTLPECLQGFVQHSTPPEMLAHMLETLQVVEPLLNPGDDQLVGAINAIFPADVVSYYRSNSSTGTQATAGSLQQANNNQPADVYA